jgi:hypothetical protein
MRHPNVSATRRAARTTALLEDARAARDARGRGEGEDLLRGGEALLTGVGILAVDLLEGFSEDALGRLF